MPYDTEQSAKELVSILLPARNESALLERSLRSITAQTYPAWEIIAIDDNSSDNTGDILQAWQSRLGPQRLTVIRNQQQRGITASLNKGLAAAAGSLIARLDADDWWTADKLGRQVSWLTANPDFGVVGCDYANHYSNWQQVVRLPHSDAQIRRSIFRRNPFGHSCVMIRTDLMRNAGGYDQRVTFGQDWELWFRLLTKTKLHNIPQVLCHRTVREPTPSKRIGQLRQAFQTVTIYTHRYNASPTNFLFLAEPVAAAITPRWIKKIVYKLRS